MTTDYESMLASDLEALAVERGIDAGKVKGTGAGGNVLKGDWIKALERLDRKEAKATAAAEPEAPEVVEDEAGDAPESAEVDPVDLTEVSGNVAAQQTGRPPTAGEKALARLSQRVFGDDAEHSESEVLTKAADLIDYLRKRA